MRLIFIPGFGEDESIFDHIHPQLPGKKVFLNNWFLLGNKSRHGLNVLQYARELVQKFAIGQNDVVIGHSLGGWIAYHIKHLTGCRIVQISSWTDCTKVVKPVKKRQLIYWFTKSGFVYNSFTKRLIIKRDYEGRPSCEIFSSIFDNLRRGSKNNVVNQLKLIFNPVHEPIHVNPDLRIHARADTIIRFPDQLTQEVPGDHFSLYTYPEKVSQPIKEFLQEGES